MSDNDARDSRATSAAAAPSSSPPRISGQPNPGQPNPGQLTPSWQTPGWLPLLFGVLAAALLGYFGYYTFKYVNSSTFNDERAFRVLGEITGQFENLQTTMVSLLSLVPEGADNERVRSRYLANLELPGLDLVDVSSTQPAAMEKCGVPGNAGLDRPRFKVSLSDPQRSFAILGCLTLSNAKRHGLYELRGSFSQHLPWFAAQRFFDEVIIVLGSGEILAKVGNGQQDDVIELHDARADGLILANAGALLRHAAAAEELGNITTTPAAPGKEYRGPNLPSHPVVFDDRIAGENYRTFVVAFTPKYAFDITGLAADADRSQQRFYLIGIKRQNLTQQITTALGPQGTLSITILVLLALLAWPLLSLRFSPAQDPISSFQVLAVIVSVMLIPVVLTICAYWAVSYLRLTTWADAGAESYARDIETRLVQELSLDTQLLQGYAQDYLARNLVADVSREECSARSSVPTVLRQQRLDPHLGSWLPLHTVAALGPNGTSCGTIASLFVTSTQAKDWLNLRDRQYFIALLEQQEWKPGRLWTRLLAQATAAGQPDSPNPTPFVPADGFVAQRLFNRTDAARALQIAIPVRGKEGLAGIATADSRAYALTADVQVPLLHFAVVDRSNGAVLFHSNDDRSLAENFLVETEQSKELRAALQRRASLYSLDQVLSEDHFSGRYLGEAHHFYHRPLAGMPWAVVVFYPTAELDDISLQSAIASLASSIGFLAVVLSPILILLLMLPGRPDLELLAFVWPKWEWRIHYRHCARAGTLVLLGAALLTVANFSSSTASHVYAIAGVLSILVAAGYLFTRRGRSSEHHRSVQRYQNDYVGTFIVVIALVIVLPSAWLIADYHDVSVQAFLRRELQQAAADIDRRRAIIAGDLRRWVPQDQQRRSDYPDPWTLSALLQVPGYHVQQATANGSTPDNRCDTWILHTFASMPWMNDAGPPALGAFRRMLWIAATPSNAPRRVTPAASQSSLDARIARVESQGRCRGDPLAVQAWLRSDDGVRIRVQASYSGGRSQHAADHTVSTLRIDEDIEWWNRTLMITTCAAVVTGLLFVLILLAWTVSRRLLGIRIPFAGRFVAPLAGRMTVGPLLDEEFKLLELQKQHPQEFTAKDASDWRAVYCAQQYEAMWNSLRQDERLLLHQLAKGRFANPENQSVIERLVHLGFLKLRPWPYISDAGFAHYARTAETEQQFATWQREASKNAWNRIRTPLLIVVLVVAAAMMWLAGSTMQILSATLAGIATIFGYITQVTNFVRKDSKPLSG